MTTFYDKGLLKAMKTAYRDGGYYVGVTEDTVIIQTGYWGMEIHKKAVPNSVKSLITLHNGGLPPVDMAVRIEKAECSMEIADMVFATFHDLSKGYTQTGGVAIKPTRLIFDGQQLWQTASDLRILPVGLEDQVILNGTHWETRLVEGFIYGRSWFGAAYLRPLIVEPDDRPRMAHLAGMQWIPVERE